METKQRRGYAWLWLAAACVGLGLMAPSLSGAAYYEGKTITIIVSSSPGGGTDTTGRLVAQFLPKFLPGNPQTMVQNMPGGGGTIANNYFTANAKPDGLMLLQDSSSGLGNFNRGGSRIKYDPRKYHAIGSVNRGGSILMIRKAVRDRLTDSKGRKLVVGDTDGIRNWVAMTVYGAEYLGWNLRFLYGYKGTGELALALRQGEIDVWATQSAKIIKELFKEGIVDALAQESDERRPDFPDVPSFIEVLGSKKPSGIAWEAHDAWTGPAEIDKFLMAAPGTSQELVKMLREAYVKMSKDEAFKKQATSFYGEGWTVRTGERTQIKVKEATTLSKEADLFLTKLRKKYNLPVGKKR